MTDPTRSRARCSATSRRSTCRTSSSISAGARCRPRRASAHRPRRWSRSIPPEQLRLLFLRPRPNTAIEFDPEGTDAIPRLFDESDRLAAATAGREVRGELPPHHDRVFTYSLVEPDADVAAEAAAYRPAFSHLALLEQIPGIDVVERVTAEKGSPLTDREAGILAERRAAARAWLEAYAPDSARLAVQRDALPERIGEADDAQRAYLGALAAALERRRRGTASRCRPRSSRPPKERELPAGRAFAALYLAFLGRPSGPRAGWLLAALDRVLRARPPARGRERRGGRVSVGLQRLREDADRLKLAAADKGEDPAVVDRAVELDERRRALVAEADALKAERNEASRRIGEAIRGGADPNGPEVGELKAASAATAERIGTLDAETRPRSRRPSTDAMLRIPNPADPDVPVGGEEANLTVRTWGEPLPREEPRAALGARPRRSGSSTTPAARRSPARAGRSTSATARPSSARSSTGSSTSTPARTA